MIFIHLGSLRRWKGLGFPGLGYQGGSNHLGKLCLLWMNQNWVITDFWMDGLLLDHIMETWERGERSSEWHRRLTWERWGGEVGGGKSQRVWFLQKTNLLGEVPILAVSLSFHEKQWCHESAAASEQKKGSKFSCSSSVVSKQASKQSKQVLCPLCVCVWTLWSPLQIPSTNSILLCTLCSSFLFMVFTHCYASENGWTEQISLTLQVCWVQPKKK